MLVLFLAAAAVQAPAPAEASYTRAVTHICSGALLFDQPHAQGTRADALAVASDIRASTAQRLARVAAVPAPGEWRALAARWIALERRLADSYADNWVRIFDVVAASTTPAERAREPARLERLVHAPDTLRLAAARIELVLRIPDCTGGDRQGDRHDLSS
jgi:hypothetical protein